MKQETDVRLEQEKPPAATTQDGPTLDPPPGVNRELWDSLDPEIHRQAADIAQGLMGKSPRRKR